MNKDEKKELKELKRWKREKEAVIENSIAKLDTYACIVNQEMNIIVADPVKRIKLRKQLIRMFKQQIKEMEERI